MERYKDLDKSKIWFGVIIFITILGVVIGVSVSNGYIVIIALIVLFVLLEFYTPISVNKTWKKRVSNRVRYRIHHCDLEVLTYSSKFRYFTENEHPMDELLDIDYKASYKRHYIKASLDEEAFIYHEEALFPTRKIPVVNMFQGFVVEFQLPVRLNKKFTINHPLLDKKYPKNFIFTNGKMMRVYIPNRRFITQITEANDIELEMNGLTDNIREIIRFKNEFLMTYKEDKT